MRRRFVTAMTVSVFLTSTSYLALADSVDGEVSVLGERGPYEPVDDVEAEVDEEDDLNVNIVDDEEGFIDGDDENIVDDDEGFIDGDDENIVDDDEGFIDGDDENIVDDEGGLIEQEPEQAEEEFAE